MKRDNEFKRTEKWLYDYKNIENYILQIELQIIVIKKEVIGCSAINYDLERVSATNNISSQVENETIEREKKIEQLESKKEFLELQKKRLDIAIRNLNSDQTILFNLVYINRNGWNRDRIIREMHISKDTYYRLKNSIVHSVINSLNPDRALREIEEMYKILK